MLVSSRSALDWNRRRPAMSVADDQVNEGAKGKQVPHGHLVIEVYNEDAGGPPIAVHGGPGEKVSKMVEAVYAKLHKQPKPDDRLTCLATGEDVRQFGDLHLLEYSAGKCGDLVWTFAHGTGGAGA
jgi:hypothetical protein